MTFVWVGRERESERAVLKTLFVRLLAIGPRQQRRMKWSEVNWLRLRDAVLNLERTFPPRFVRATAGKRWHQSSVLNGYEFTVDWLNVVVVVVVVGWCWRCCLSSSIRAKLTRYRTVRMGFSVEDVVGGELKSVAASVIVVGRYRLLLPCDLITSRGERPASEISFRLGKCRGIRVRLWGCDRCKIFGITYGNCIWWWPFRMLSIYQQEKVRLRCITDCVVYLKEENGEKKETFMSCSNLWK